MRVVSLSLFLSVCVCVSVCGVCMYVLRYVQVCLPMHVHVRPGDYLYRVPPYLLRQVLSLMLEITIVPRLTDLISRLSPMKAYPPCMAFNVGIGDLTHVLLPAQQTLCPLSPHVPRACVLIFTYLF